MFQDQQLDMVRGSVVEGGHNPVLYRLALCLRGGKHEANNPSGPFSSTLGILERKGPNTLGEPGILKQLIEALSFPSF